MVRGKEFDDLAVVRAARDLFWERGYASTSLSDLLTATGLSKSSLYQTYGSKRGLFGRAAANYTDEFVGLRLAPLGAPDAGVAEVVACFDGLIEYLRSAPQAQVRWGCMMVNIAVGLADLDEAAAVVVREFQRRMCDGYARALAGAVEDPERTARVLTAGWIGTTVLAHLDPALAADHAEALIADLRTEKALTLPSASGPRRRSDPGDPSRGRARAGS